MWIERTEKLKRRIITALLSVILIFSFAPSSFALQTEEPVPDGLYSISPEGVYNRFYNYVGGYSLLVPTSMSVDMSMAGVCAVLENNEQRIEIFNQSLGGGVSKAGYMNYSNGFLSNRTDHYLEYQGTQTIGGRSVHITQWSRNKLSRVENDKNYYICMDISVSGSEVVTIMMKSSLPIYESGGYTYLLSSFQTIGKTASPYIRTAKAGSKASGTWNHETQTWFEHYFSASSPLTWGIFEPHAPDDFRDLDTYEQQVDYEFPVILNYSSFENTYKHSNLISRLESTYNAGKTLELTLQPDWTATGQSNMVYSILNGMYDEFLRDYAKTVADFGHPVLFRLGNEMNGDWCSYSSYNTSRDPMVFKEFYKYVYSFFEEAGAKNVIWVWNPNGKSFPDFTWNHELMYYPGDEYVDIVGLTAYNTGTYYSDETWQTFAQLYDNLYYGYIERYEKPLMITEFASASMGGDKNQWVIDMFNHIKYYDKIKMAVWWDGCDWDTNGRIARSYFIDDPAILIDTFRNHLRDAVVSKPEDVTWKQDSYAALN